MYPSKKVLKNLKIIFTNYLFPQSTKKEKPINFNKNYFKKLTNSYDEFIKTHDIKEIINSIIKFDRSFENWDQINKSIVLSIFSEIEITKKEKVKILLNDYMNISKTLIPKKDLGMINAITDKYLSDKQVL